MTTPTPQVANTPGAASLAQGAGSTLSVTWTAPAVDGAHSAATGFNLRSSPSGAGTWTTVTGVTSPYSLSGLAAGTATDVELQSSNAAGASAWSAISTLIAASGAPNTPGAISLAQGAGSNLTVAWTAPAVDSTHNAAAGINLRSSPSGAGSWTTVSGVASPYTLSGLAAGAAIDVQLEGVNAVGTSAWSATTTLATASGAPNTPSAVSLAQGTGSNLTVTWTAPAVDGTHSAASGFNLRSSPSGAGSWTIVTGVASAYSLSGLAAGAAIDVQIQSTNAAGASAWSATTTLTTAAGAPNTPSAASLAQGTGSNLTVTWTAPAVDSTHSAATGFNLRSSPSGAGTWTTVSGVTSPHSLSGLAAGAAIDVQSQSTNAAGVSAWSATSTLTTATAAPNAPAIAGVAPLPDGTNTKLTVTWTAPTVDSTHNAATGYNLRSSPLGAGTWTTVSGVTSPYTLTGLSGATAIDFEVQGTNAAASPGGWSTVATGTTWGSTVAPGGWIAAASQVHSTNVAPNGGVQMVAAAAPTAVTGAAFAWSASNSTIPTTGLIAASSDGQTNGWAQYFSAPATAGTFYLWSLAQGAGATTIGALVTPAITVS
jgi:titin